MREGLFGPIVSSFKDIDLLSLLTWETGNQ